MKKGGLILLIFYCLICIASASVEVHNYTFKTTYYPYEEISGKINLTILNENSNSKLYFGNSEKIPLKDFLTTNGVAYQCSPSDCSKNYNFSSNTTDKTFYIDSEHLYGGFVLSGTNIFLTSLDFSIESNFETNNRNPLSIDFFDESIWKFNTFSDVFSSKLWGCYNTEIPSQGPLIGTSSYCEMILISDTGALNIGAYVDSGDDKTLNMKIYPEDGGGYLGGCNYNPNLKDGCRIDAEEEQIFETGQYQICVSSDSLTNYHIYEEYFGNNCGFVYSMGPESSIKDYAIFAQTTEYANADSFSSADIDLAEATSIADNLIETRYNRDCSDGCILPLAFSGIPQTLRIYNITLQYTQNGENYQEKNIYNLEPIPATVDFSGVLDLSLTKFNISKSGTYSFYLGDKKLFEKQVEKIPTPIITSLSPLNPPAGVPVQYYINVDYDTLNTSLTYKWDFKDKTYTTTTNSVIHTFAEIKNYTISIEVSVDKNLTSKKSFVINTINPAEAVNTALSKKSEALNNIIKKLNIFPIWYQEALKKTIDISFYEDELNRLKKAQTNIIEDEDFLTIAKDLYSLDIPTEISTDENTYPFLWTKLNDINPRIISNIAGSSDYEDLEDYKNPILNWQTQNIKGSFSTKVFSVSKWNGEIIPFFRTYEFNISSFSDDEIYFVINHPQEEIYFNKLSGARKIENATVIIFDKNETKSFELYYKSPDETTFFISPKLSKIIIEKEIDITCNFNNFCEKDLGENSNTCRSDCKPFISAILYVIFAIVFAVIIYTLLQIWYGRHYENHLFNNHQELYNLLMYITNARARNQTDNTIIKTLREHGWSSERLSYAIKKSRGRRTGIFELIPISKITSCFRNWKAKKKIATTTQLQNERNINKSEFQKK